MTVAPKRLYSAKDVDMLITASTVIETAIANKTFLQSKRSTWGDPFFDNIKTRIENAMQDFLGIDNAKELRKATIALVAIQAQALEHLAEVKVQIIEDFKNDTIQRDEILKQLGFTSYHKEAQNRDQEALINLLYQFKKNLTSELKATIVAAGTAAVTLTIITNYADDLKDANVTQETFKGSKQVITAEAVTVFNEIYEVVISICKIAAKFYKDQPAVQNQFSFAKVSKTLNFNPKAAPPVTPAP